MSPIRSTGCAVVALFFAAGPALSVRGAAPEPQRTASSARADVMSKFSRRISMEVVSRRLEDIVAWIAQAGGLVIEPLWSDDRHAAGLDKGALVSIKVEHESVLSLLERVLEQADSGVGDGTTWQLTRTGAIQIGPRSRLNAFRRTEVYDVSDLLKIVPDHRHGPTIDLQQALQSRGNGSPISQTDRGDDWVDQLSQPQERAEALATLIHETVEPGQWIENGGNGGSVRVYQNSLIVSAPDYVHRGIGGPPR